MIDIIRLPDYAEVLVEKDEINDASLRYEVQNDRVNVYLSAPTSHPKIVKLRWNAKIDREVRILGDAWERSYGDLGFTGLTTEKAHPWYFIMKHRDGTDCVGVAVRPAALISWVVDCEGVTVEAIPGGFAVELVEKGSITIDGVSLTVAALTEQTFSVCLIPQTLADTALSSKVAGTFVNLEGDIIGKYVRRFLEVANNSGQEEKASSGITYEKLREAGFL